MKLSLVVALIAITLAGCTSGEPAARLATTGSESDAKRLSEDEKHRLYSAALATSDAPLDTKIFNDVCKTIGIYDVSSKPTDRYMPFVQAHIDWGTRSENEAFRHQIDSKAKAMEYVATHLSTGEIPKVR